MEDTPYLTIVHYDEISLKGGNRVYFEKKLVDNIQYKLRREGIADTRIQRLFGRITIAHHSQDHVELTRLSNALATTFGIAFFAHAIRTKNVLDEIIRASLHIINEHTFDSFAVSARRSDKATPFHSKDICIAVGAAIQKKTNARVDLKKPDITVQVDVTGDGTFVYADKIPGPGGLPTGTQGKVLVLLSGGIDSPVAAYMMAKRGVTPVYIHFHSYPFTSDASIAKVRRLVDRLNAYTGPAELFLQPFSEIQKQIVYAVPDAYRIIIYRRMMMRIAAQFAYSIGAQALVTGEAMGQVASQTLENMTVIDNATDMPILRPLVGFDKKDIIQKALNIDTYGVSIEPHDDCCTVFMPKNPITKAKLRDIEKIESQLDIHALVQAGLHAVKAS